MKLTTKIHGDSQIEIYEGETLIGTIEVTRDAVQSSGMRVVEMTAKGVDLQSRESGRDLLMSSIASGGAVRMTRSTEVEVEEDEEDPDLDDDGEPVRLDDEAPFHMRFFR